MSKAHIDQGAQATVGPELVTNLYAEDETEMADKFRLVQGRVNVCTSQVKLPIKF